MADDPRGQILHMLAEAGTWVSGEELAGRLGMSRAAVGKHVARLRRDGHVVDSSTRKGFWLRMAAEPVDPEQVRPHLRTRVLGRGLWRCLEETASTNSEAVALALDGAPAGTVVTAESQSRGKGRRGHSWFSSPRALQFSLVLRPQAADPGGERATRAAQAALVDAVGALVPDCAAQPKPPNDILLGGRKLAGILVETGMRGDEPDWLVLGVGANVNVLPDEFPQDLAPRVTSIYAHTGVAVSRNRLLGEFLSRFEIAWETAGRPFY